MGQAQRVATPGGRGLVVGESWRGPGRGCVAARPLRDFPQLMGKRGLALGDGPWGPGGLHVRQFTFTWREGGEIEDRKSVTDKDVVLQLSWLQATMSNIHIFKFMFQFHVPLFWTYVKSDFLQILCKCKNKNNS